MAVYNIQTGEYHYVSNEIKNILGFEPADILKGGLDFFWSLVHPNDRERIEHEYFKAMEFIEATNTNHETYWHEFEYRVKDKDDKYVWVNTRGRVFSFDDEGKTKEIVNLTTPISHDKKLKKNGENEADFETIAQLAGEICHELNNPLQSLSLLIEILIKQEEEKQINGKDVDGTSVHLYALKTIFGKISGLRENLHRLSMK